MKILGVGLSKTGTSSLHAALQLLNFKSLHFDEVRLNDVLDGSNTQPNFRRYDDVDAVLDLPSAYFYEELLAAYPECKCILTTRDADEWWTSVARYFNDRFPVDRVLRGRVHARAVRFLDRSLDRERQYWTPEQSRFRIQLRNYVYGSAQAHEYLYKKKYREHNERVLRTVPPERLLVMNVTAGDGWANLCPFLGLPIPATPFPHENKTPGN